jgi:hypothetical protein
MGSLFRKLQRRVHRRLFVNVNARHEASVFVAGTGRSGTTWAADIINFRNDHRVLFEPFYPQKVALVRHFRYRQYLRPDNEDLAYVEPARAILTGRVRNPWIDRENRTLWASKRLIKDIRANLLLRWMYTRFPGMRMILIFRHPCAVANSKLKLRWSTHLKEFLEQPELMEDFLSPVRAEMAAAQSDFDKHIFLWCVENYVPLKQFRRGELHLAFYEPFCQDPQAETERLFSFLGRKAGQRIQSHLKTPSTMVRAGSAILSGSSLTDSWRKDISNDQIKRCTEILHLFGLDKVYGEDSLPDIEAACSMMSPP